MCARHAAQYLPQLNTQVNDRLPVLPPHWLVILQYDTLIPDIWVYSSIILGETLQKGQEVQVKHTEYRIDRIILDA